MLKYLSKHFSLGVYLKVVYKLIMNAKYWDLKYNLVFLPL